MCDHIETLLTRYYIQFLCLSNQNKEKIILLDQVGAPYCVLLDFFFPNYHTNTDVLYKRCFILRRKRVTTVMCFQLWR